MKRLDDLQIGHYQPGESWLHRVDARSKILLLPLLIMVGFRASTWSELLVLILVAVCLMSLASVGWRGWLKSMRPLRWLLLATVLLHLFFSPGKTLFGTTWLSFDGLLAGLLRALQLCLAMSFASLLSMTTSADELTSAFSCLLKPFKVCGIATERIVDLLGLVMNFIPILREESRQVLESRREDVGQVSRGAVLERGRAVSRLLEPLILRLADRADAMAIRLAAGERLLPTSSTLPMSFGAQLTTFFACLSLVLWVIL